MYEKCCGEIAIQKTEVKHAKYLACAAVHVRPPPFCDVRLCNLVIGSRGVETA
jgi:hypothetical protein